MHHCHALFPAGREIVDTVVDEQARAQGNVERSLQRGEDLRVGLAGTDVTTDDPRPYPGLQFESPAQQHRPLADVIGETRHGDASLIHRVEELEHSVAEDESLDVRTIEFTGSAGHPKERPQLTGRVTAEAGVDIAGTDRLHVVDASTLTHKRNQQRVDVVGVGEQHSHRVEYDDLDASRVRGAGRRRGGRRRSRRRHRSNGGRRPNGHPGWEEGG